MADDANITFLPPREVRKAELASSQALAGTRRELQVNAVMAAKCAADLVGQAHTIAAHMAGDTPYDRAVVSVETPQALLQIKFIREALDLIEAALSPERPEAA